MENKPQPPDTNSRFWQSSPDYHGVLAEAGLHRLTVSPNGKRYQIQRRLDGPQGPAYAVLKWRKALSLLGPDLPADLAAVVPALPELASDVVRPWAHATESASARFKRVIPLSDTYAGVIAVGENARLVWMHPAQGSPRSAPSYCLQVRSVGKRWEPVSRSVSTARLLDIFSGDVSLGSSFDFLLGDKVLTEVLHSLPARAKDYQGAKPERLEDVQASLGRPPSLKARSSARSRREKVASGGEPPQSRLKRLQRPENGS